MPSLRLARPSIDDRSQVYRWLTAPGVVEHMFGPPQFSDAAVPSFEEFCNDWSEHFWTHSSPKDGRLFLNSASTAFLCGTRSGSIALFPSKAASMNESEQQQMSADPYVPM